MNDSNETKPAAEQQAASASKKDKLTLIAILAVFILPFIILPMVMSPQEQAKTNKGFFVQPHVEFEKLPLQPLPEQNFDRLALNGKWVMLYVIPSECDKACSNALFAMRQVRRALDRDVDRVTHLLIQTDETDEKFEALLEQEFSFMMRAAADMAVIDSLFSAGLGGESASRQGYIYLMSPDGYIFMYYPSHEDEQESVLRARDIRKDLKKSMKGSLIG